MGLLDDLEAIECPLSKFKFIISKLREVPKVAQNDFHGKRPRHKPSLFIRVLMKHDPCVYCGRPSKGLDHIVPVSQGGDNGHQNRAAACSRCDELKRDQKLLIFLLKRKVSR